MVDKIVLQRHLLRVEGVNMNAYIFNTNDLGAMRGAGLSLLNAVKALKTSVPGLSGAKEIALGASSGLFEVQTDNIETLLHLVRSALQAVVPHGTFVVDAVPYPENEDDFRLAVEKLIALNRWRQAMACSLSIPSINRKKLGKPACALEGTRPARIRATSRSGSRISTAVAWQRRKGRTAKQQFYKSITDLADPKKYASSFEEIALYGAEHPRNNKMAVFYADGNSFGKIQRETCSTQNLQSSFDQQVQQRRKAFLTAFLTEYGDARKHPAWFNNEMFRFETLLWGGDEFMFVMPASLGWEFARFFFQQFPDNEENNFQKKALTYTASLVFCHHHAPIRRIKHLLKDGLAEVAKEKGGRNEHQLIVQALESYDNLGEDVEAGLLKRYGGLVTIPDLILRPHAGKPLHVILEEIQKLVTALSLPGSEFSRSQLRALIHRMLDATADAERLAKLEDGAPRGAQHAFRNAAGKLVTANAFLALFPKPVAAWLHLEELWDYAR